jgi:Endonuclease/Exonuclease/phosphatase family
MLNGICLRVLRILILMTLVIRSGYSQGPSDQHVRVMFYNVENLFDVYDDTLKNDDDFLPDGTHRWNFTRYNKKINSLYKTIVAAGEWNPPIVVGLCEVENRKVLKDLIYDTYLNKFNYGIIHEESPDHRGIDVCLIFRKEFADIIDYQYWIPSEIGDEIFTSRSVLYAKMAIKADTIHFIINHWPSRRGGVLAAETTRRVIAKMVKTKIDSIVVNSNYEAKLVIMGDFNCTPLDQVMRLLVDPSDSNTILMNLTEEMAIKGKGTYRYRGIWEMIDQILVSEWLIRCGEGIYTDAEKFRVFKPDFLLMDDLKYPGDRPLSTYRGYKYQGGYSDHLPILLDLGFR